VHQPASDGVKYYFTPTNLAELKSALVEAAKAPGATVRVSGQRHSQPPLVVDDDRGAAPQTKAFLIDMSCYKDLGSAHDQRIVPGPGSNQVTVNTGVREDELDAFLAKNNLMLTTVTAGGFFSLGGMTAVDVHGGTTDAPIFAETVSAFTLLLADGSVTTIDAQSPKVGSLSPLQCARVSLGGLGIVTSITIDVESRPWATTLQGGTERFGLADKAAFVKTFGPLLKNHTRLETFFTPYATSFVPLSAKNFLTLWWDVVSDPPTKTPNAPPSQDNACVLAAKQPPQFGAPYLGAVAKFGADVAERAQYDYAALDPFAGPAVIAAITFDVIEPDVATANTSHSDLWLTGAVQVIFMSYYIPLPGLNDAGLEKVWNGLDVVSRIVTRDGAFHMAAPMEFRFVKGGDTAMSATFAENPQNTWFGNLDLIGFVKKEQKPSDYSPKLLQFFADVEREWVKMGGFPHNGKMYGFYDPTAAAGTHTAPFNPNFLADLRRRRGARLAAFAAYRKSLDPKGLFYNRFLQSLLES
jgi:FAD/FMN-containing dehydrogenase